jgi:hypothetical protein
VDAATTSPLSPSQYPATARISSRGSSSIPSVQDATLVRFCPRAPPRTTAPPMAPKQSRSSGLSSQLTRILGIVASHLMPIIPAGELN